MWLFVSHLRWQLRRSLQMAALKSSPTRTQYEKRIKMEMKCQSCATCARFSAAPSRTGPHFPPAGVCNGNDKIIAAWLHYGPCKALICLTRWYKDKRAQDVSPDTDTVAAKMAARLLMTLGNDLDDKIPDTLTHSQRTDGMQPNSGNFSSLWKTFGLCCLVFNSNIELYSQLR